MSPPTRQLGFVFHFIIVFKVVIASQVCLDSIDNSNRSFVLGDTVCQERSHWSAIVLAIIWVLLHVILFLDTAFPIIMTKRVRLAAPHKMS